MTTKLRCHRDVDDLDPIARDLKTVHKLIDELVSDGPLARLHPDEEMNDALNTLSYLTDRLGDHVAALRRVLDTPADLGAIRQGDQS